MIYLRKKTASNTKALFLDSLRISHLIASGILLIIFAVLFILPQDALLMISPQCEWKIRYGVECFFCGMTRAFISISKADISSAMNLNPFSVPLFLIMIFNEIYFVFTIKASIKKIKNNYRLQNADY